MTMTRPDPTNHQAANRAASDFKGDAMAAIWHAGDCGGTCDGCGHIAADGFWYNAPCPDDLLKFQIDWAESGVPNAVRAE